MRSFIYNQGYYAIAYKQELEKEMKKEDIVKWAKELQVIKAIAR